MELTNQKSITVKLVNGIFLIILNLVLVAIVGYLTIDSWANINSRFAGILLSFFIPVFIVYKTQGMSSVERLAKFGFGYFIYGLVAIVIVDFGKPFAMGLLPCLVIAMATLYYGEIFLNRKAE